MTNSMKVLIADDSAIVRARLRTLLSELGGIDLIGEATDGPEAERLLRETRPDVAIFDIRMPNGSGIDLVRTAKELKDVPVVIILTNYTSPQYRTACLQAGADFFFDKSTEFMAVADVLQDLIGKDRDSES